MKYRNFIFDLDGTLADTSPGVFEGIRLVLRQMGEPPVPEDQLSRFIGPPLHISFAAVCGMKEPRLHEAVGIFREYYKNGGVYNSAVPRYGTAAPHFKRAGRGADGGHPQAGGAGGEPD